MVWRVRCETTLSISRMISGWPASSSSKAGLSSTSSWLSVSALALAERGAPVSSDISPKNWPSVKKVSTFSLPLGSVVDSRMRPPVTMNSASPASP